MKLANLTGTFSIIFTNAIINKRVPLNDNYYPVKGTMPNREILELINNEFDNYSEKDLSMTLSVVRKRKFESYEVEIIHH